MSPRRCAFLSTDSLEDYVVNDALAIPAIERRGWSVDTVSWRSKQVDWNDYELVVIRSPWDYQSAPEAFLQVLETIDRSSAQLENPLSIVRWNLVKTYLRDLQRRGACIVPTQWFESWDQPQIEAAFDAFQVAELVLKPTVGANADHAVRVRRETLSGQAPELAARFGRRPHMAQPFVESIQHEGEFSLFYFGGEYSHAVRKVPGVGDFRVQEEHGGQIDPHDPEPPLRAAADSAVAGIDAQLLYARVDLVLCAGTYALMELELVEPSLYFDKVPAAVERFADALDGLITR